MTIASILVATDLSMQENVTVRRALRLAVTHRATVKLMYVPPHGQRPLADASARLGRLAMQLQDILELRVRVVPAKLHTLQDLCAEARSVDLLVLPHRRERSTAAFFRGQPVLRVLRGAQCPVLVTRHAQDADYRCILVAVDFSAHSGRLVQLAADLDAHAQLQLFHAVDTSDEAKLRSAEAKEHALQAYRERRLRHARERMVTLTDPFLARRNRLMTHIGRGDPGWQLVAQQEHSQADLVIVGKRRSSAWEDFFCGSVAHRVLSWGTSDVLVVPLGVTPATAPLAARRVRGKSRPSALHIPLERRT